MKLIIKSKKYIIISLIILTGLLVLYGFRLIDHLKIEKERKAQYAQASSNAIQYVRDKYGFEPEKIESEEEFLDSPYIHNARDLTLKMWAEGREFDVSADNQKDNPVGMDNYQLDEIKNAIIRKITESYPAGEVIDLWASDSNLEYNLFTKLFNGDNIEEVLEDGYGYFEMVFVDTEFTDNEITKALKKWNLNTRFTSFDTKERLDEFVKIQYKNEETYEKYQPYITDRFEISFGKESRIKYFVKSCDEFRYCYFPTDSNKYTDNSYDITISEEEQSSFISHFENYDEGNYVSKPLSKAYQFDDLYGDICIYYPVSLLKDHDIEQVGAAWFSPGGQINNRDIAKAEICGEYAVFVLPFDKQEFMLVDMSGQGKYIPGWVKELEK
ncbi:MAG: hypothetical protein Q4F95_05025 [Oscillospiraceae bacterium]|nr:hypothetical protein [Oscillospiraceae bacterium]